MLSREEKGKLLTKAISTPNTSALEAWGKEQNGVIKDCETKKTNGAEFSEIDAERLETAEFIVSICNEILHLRTLEENQPDVNLYEHYDAQEPDAAKRPDISAPAAEGPV